MNTKIHPVFVKEIPLVILYQGNSVFVQLATGFTKFVDPSSGMTVNLMKVLAWQDAFKNSMNQRHISSWIQFCHQAFQFFQSQAALEQAKCQFLQIRFFDSSLIRFENSKFEIQKTAVVVDAQKNLRILTAFWPFQTDQELFDIQRTEIQSPLPILFSEVTTVNLSFLQKPSRIELKDPLTRESEIFS